MLGYPPRPTSILPNPDYFDPNEWIGQIKYRGWRIVNHKNISYTRKGNIIPIETDYRTDFDYQLDGEIISSVFPSTEYQVKRAVKDGTHQIVIFDIYLPDQPRLELMDRLDFLKQEFGIVVKTFPIHSYEYIAELTNKLQKDGHEGLVLKKKDGIYQLSKICELIPSDWIKVK